MSSPHEPAKNPSPNARPAGQADTPEPPLSKGPGHVFLVGAGPGDPSLITLKGVRCLQSADVVLYDYLANPRLLDLVPDNAETICLGRHGQGRLWTQQDAKRHRDVRPALGRESVLVEIEREAESAAERNQFAGEQFLLVRER